MLPVGFEEANYTIRKPAHFDVPVWKGMDSREQDWTVSYWVPSKEDLERLNAGGGIFVKTEGISDPVIDLFTHNPFKHDPGT